MASGGPQSPSLLLESRVESSSFIHSLQCCELCNRGRDNAEYFCEECDKCICPTCLPAHNTLTKEHRIIATRVSRVDGRCGTDGHGDRTAAHACLTCREVLCDDCLGNHLEQDHDCSELQSVIAERKTTLSQCIAKKKAVQEGQESFIKEVEQFLPLIEQTFASLCSDVDRLYKDAIEQLGKSADKLRNELKIKEQSYLKKLQKLVNDKKELLALMMQSTVDAAKLLDSDSARDILTLSDEVVEKLQIENCNGPSVACLNHVRCDIARTNLIPHTGENFLGTVQSVWEEKNPVELRAVDIKRSVLVHHPSGGFLVGFSHRALPPVSSGNIDLPDNFEGQLPMKTTLHFCTSNGAIERTEELGSLNGNEIVRDLAVFPSSMSAVLGRDIELFDFKEKPCLIRAPDEVEWHSLVIDPSGFLFAGDCKQNKIDVLDKEGNIKQTISCFDFTPWQLHTLPTGGFVIAQHGFQGRPVVHILDASGEIKQSISDKTWQYAYCTVDGYGNIYIAHLKEERCRETEELTYGLFLHRYNSSGLGAEVILTKKSLANCVYLSMAAQTDGTCLGLTTRNKLWIYH